MLNYHICHLSLALHPIILMIAISLIQKVSRMRFGWIDFIDDLEVSKALLDKVQEIGIQENLDFMEGPLGFSNLDKVGFHGFYVQEVAIHQFFM